MDNLAADVPSANLTTTNTHNATPAPAPARPNNEDINTTVTDSIVNPHGFGPRLSCRRSRFIDLYAQQLDVAVAAALPRFLLAGTRPSALPQP